MLHLNPLRNPAKNSGLKLLQPLSNLQIAHKIVPFVQDHPNGLNIRVLTGLLRLFLNMNRTTIDYGCEFCFLGLDFGLGFGVGLEWGGGVGQEGLQFYEES